MKTQTFRKMIEKEKETFLIESVKGIAYFFLIGFVTFYVYTLHSLNFFQKVLAILGQGN